MKRYVLCYAESIDNPDTDWVVLIDKISPQWQKGRLNLPGGEIEPDEKIIDAACRELEEETDLISQSSQCRVLGKMFGDDWIVYVVLCPFQGPFKVRYNGPERPLVVSLHQVLCVGSRILPELRTIIPLCIARHPWHMFINANQSGFTYTLTVEDY